jgi:drug/metabolite transporter (DMT)-like permease
MLIASAVIYSLLFQFNKMAADAGADFFSHAFWQTGLGGAALLVMCLTLGQSVSFRWSYLRAYLVVGAFGFGLPMALLTFVAPNLPPGIISLVLALSPTFTYLASALARLDRMSIYGVLGIALGFAGVAVILVPDSALPGADAAWWFLLAMITPVLLAVANVSAALLRPPATSSIAMGAGFLLGAALSLVPLMLIFGQSQNPLQDGLVLPTIGAAAVNGVFIVLFAEIVRRYGPTFFAQFNYLAVLAAIGWAAIFFGDVPTLYALVALVLMAAGVLISERRHRAKAVA